jgi:hypothetical protein
VLHINKVVYLCVLRVCRLICVWDLEGKGVEAEGPGASTKRLKTALPQQLMFQHAGHRAPVSPQASLSSVHLCIARVSVGLLLRSDCAALCP